MIQLNSKVRTASINSLKANCDSITTMKEGFIMANEEKYIAFTGDIHKTKSGYWMAAISLFIDNRKFNQCIMGRTKKDVKTKVENKEYLQKLADSYIFTKDGLIQIPMGL